MTARTVPAGRVEARARLSTAEAYLQVAQLVLSEPDRHGFANVAAGNAVLAGIAASDAICAARLRQIHRGDDHRAAARLLATATPDGKRLAATLTRLLDLKDTSQYGTSLMSSRNARDAARWAGDLVARARTEIEA